MQRTGVCVGRIVLGMVTAGLAQTKPSPQVYSVDFLIRPTSLDAAGPKAGPDVAASGSSFGADVSRLPFELTVVSVDRGSYAVGERIVYELLLRHTGTLAFSLPWSRNSNDVRGAARIQTAAFLLTFTDPAMGTQIVGSANVLYGSPGVPSSLIVLRPGDTVRIRCEGLWSLSPFPQRHPPGWSKEVAVKGELQLGGVNDVVPVLDSLNSTRIQLRQK